MICLMCIIVGENQSSAVFSQTESVCATFDAFPFYLLRLADQRKFVVVMQRAQLPTVLRCGTLKLNMELFVLVMKNTFSVAALLLTMAEEEQ